MRFWLFVHLVAFVLLSAGVVTTSMLLVAARKTTSIATHQAYAGLLKRVSVLNPVGGLLAVVSGTALAMTQGYSLGAPWISVAYTLWLVMLLVGMFVMRPFGATVGAALAEAARGQQTESDALRALYVGARPKLGARVLEITFLLLVIDMVWGPTL